MCRAHACVAWLKMGGLADAMIKQRPYQCKQRKAGAVIWQETSESRKQECPQSL